MDDHGLELAEAWTLTRATFGYTNHSLLPEALESWAAGPCFERMLPRLMQIVYAINAMVLREARAAKILDDAAISNISVIDESGERRVRMANLAFAGSHSVNGVAALHTELMKQTVFADLHKLYPDRINNMTKWRDAAPLAARMQSGPHQPDPRGDRRRVHGRCREVDGRASARSWRP